MAQSELSGASPNAHLLIGQMPAPHDLHGHGWEGTGLSIAAHAIVLGILAYAATHVPEVAQTASGVTSRFKVVFLDRAGADGRRGSGETSAADPATPPQLIQARPIELTPAAHPIDTPPAPEMIIPAVMVQTEQMLPGAAVPVDPRSTARGSGPGGGRGPGSGPGESLGLGPGGPAGHGGVFGVGNGVNPPLLVKEVKPNYTGQAMRAKLQGAVEMEAVVLPDGSVDPASIRITRSLDSIFGLDEQASIAVKQWRFRPGTFEGRAIAVRVAVELTFTLR
jgi:TonB family protein